MKNSCSPIAAAVLLVGILLLNAAPAQTSPRASNRIHFDIEGPGEIVATDNADPTNLESFFSHDRQAFNGKCLVIVRGKPGQAGTLKVTASEVGLKNNFVSVKTLPQ